MKKTNIPQHIAIIMDGNRRWAKKRRLPILAGHDYAAKKVLENIVEHAAKVGVKYITLWAFSTENWQRDKKEVDGLMQIFRWALVEQVKTFLKKSVKLVVIGDTSLFPKDIQNGIKNALEKTKNGKNITVVLAVNYGGRDEIIRAINKMNKNLYIRHSGLSRIVYTVSDSGVAVAPQNDGVVTEEKFSKFLDTKDLPDPDLLIRTGGEKRISGFLPWQTVYTELYFTDTLWPDFSPTDLDLAIEEFQNRERRFGK